MAKYNRQVVFVHIPKTAGLSLHYALLRSLGEDDCLRVGNLEKYNALFSISEVELRKKKYIGGHLFFNEIYDRLGSDPLYFTVFRDPVARCISAFHYVNSFSGHPAHADFLKMTFGDYLRRESETIRSMMCRQISGYSTAVEAFAVFKEMYWDGVNVEEVDELGHAISAYLNMPISVGVYNVTSGFAKIMLTGDDLDLLHELTREDRKLVAMFSDPLGQLHRATRRSASSLLAIAAHASKSAGSAKKRNARPRPGRRKTI